MSRIYKFHNTEGDYFVSFAVIEWLDVFTRNEYKDKIKNQQATPGINYTIWKQGKREDLVSVK